MVVGSELWQPKFDNQFCERWCIWICLLKCKCQREHSPWPKHSPASSAWAFATLLGNLPRYPAACSTWEREPQSEHKHSFIPLLAHSLISKIMHFDIAKDMQEFSCCGINTGGNLKTVLRNAWKPIVRHHFVSVWTNMTIGKYRIWGRTPEEIEWKIQT